MRKNYVIGELIYILANYEKGRVNSSVFWTKRYIRSLKESLAVILNMIQLIETDVLTNDSYFSLVSFIENNIDIIFPLDRVILEKWKNDSFYLETSELRKEHKNINKEMVKLIQEIISLLDKRANKYRLKISYLIGAIHNLPKVYLNPNATTLCNIGISPISYEDAIDYASSYRELV